MRVRTILAKKLGVISALGLALAACGDDKVTGSDTADTTGDVLFDTSVATDTNAPADTFPTETQVPETLDTSVPNDTNVPLDTEPADTTADTAPQDTGEPTDTDEPNDTTPADTTPNDTADTTPNDTADTTPSDTADTTPNDTADTTPSDTTPTDTTPNDTDTVTPGDGESCSGPHVVTVPVNWTAAVVVSGDTGALSDDHAVVASQCANMPWDEGLGGNDEVWALTAPKAGVYTVTLTSDDTDLGVYLLTSCPADLATATCASGSDLVGVGAENADVVSVKLAAGQTFFAVVDSFVDATTPAVAGAYELSFAAPVAAPAGDECGNAQSLTLAGGVYSGSGSIAYTDAVIDDYDGESCGGEPIAGFGLGGGDQVWRFVAPTAGDWLVTVTPDDDQSDPMLYVFDGAMCGPACLGPTVDDGDVGVAEAQLLTLTQGQTISIVVDTFLSFFGGPYTIEVSTCQAVCDVGACGMDDGCGGTCGCNTGEVCSALGECEIAADGGTCADPRVLVAGPGPNAGFDGAGDLTAAGLADNVQTGTCELLGEFSFPDDGAGTADEAWTFTVASAGNYEIEVLSEEGADVFYMLFQGTGCADAACVGYVDNAGSGEIDSFVHALTPGAYTLVIDSWEVEAAGAYVIAVSAACLPECNIGECGNDDGCGGECGCAFGEVCDVDVCIDDTGDTCVAPYVMLEEEAGDFLEIGDLSEEGVGDDYNFDDCELINGVANDGRGTPDEVFTFEIAEDGDYVIEVLNDPDVDTFFALFEGDLCDDTSACVGQVDNGAAGDSDLWAFSLPAGTYTIVVDAYQATSVGAYLVTVTPFELEEKCAPDLFFSEYVEGGEGTNKVLEIYNGTGDDVDLADYQIWRANNGALVASPGGHFDIGVPDATTMLADGQTWVICHGQSDDVFLAFCDQDAGASLLTNFNGNDFIGLVNIGGGDAELIDAIGVEGEDPGAEGWIVGAGSTTDYVLWRSPAVSEGDPSWDTAVDGWIAEPASNIDEALENADIGFHDVIWTCPAVP